MVSSVESAPAADDDPVGCYPAPDLFVDAITKRLNEPSQSITNAFALQNGENLIYISAHIVEGGKRVSSADVWVVDRDFGSIYAVSDQAVSLTSMSDAPTDLGVDVADQWGSKSRNASSRTAAGRPTFTPISGRLRRYVEAVGGSLRVEVELGDDRFNIA